MASTSGKKWVFAVLLVLIVPALAVHVSCVAVIGPGSWGSGMEIKAPHWLAVPPDGPVATYSAEFASEKPPEPLSQSEPSLPEQLAGLRNELAGKPFWTDYSASQNLAVVATSEGQRWVERQHFYLWSGDGTGPPEAKGIRDLGLPSGMILARPSLMRRGADTFVVVERWRPWAIAPLEKLSRYLRSYADPTLRPELSQYTFALPAGPLTYWGPGHTLKPSPDRRFAILMRSGALGAGYYSLHLWDFEDDTLTTIVSLREAEQGSGPTFDYAWSRDSRAVHITGETGGFKRRGGERRSLDLIYVVGSDGLYDLQTAGQTSESAALTPHRVR